MALVVETLAADPASGATDLSSPQAVERRRLLATMLMREGSDSSPIRSPWQGAARMANAIMGGLEGSRADAEERSGKAGVSNIFASLTPSAGSVSGSVTSPAPQASAPADLLPTFAQAGTRHGISPDYLSRTAQIESGMNPNAHNPSGADGMFQFMPGTARQYGLTNPRDPAASAEAAARLAEDNKRVLVASLGRDPSNAELYLAHQQGAGGASKLLANPDAPAVNIVGRQAVIQNGGRPDMTAGQFAGLWLNKFGGAPASQPTSIPVQTAQATPQIDQAKLMAVLSNPWATPAQQQIAAALLQREQKQESWSAPERDEAGNMIQRNVRTGEVKVLSSPRAPLSVGEGQTLIDPVTRKVIATGPQKRGIETDVAARRNVVEAQGGDPNDPRNQQFINTGKYPREDAQPLSATDKKAILEADEGVAAAQNAIDALSKAKELSKTAYGGVGSGTRSVLGANLPDYLIPDVVAAPEKSTTTQELDNLVGTNALSQLKAIFGGNPTEGERAIMIELQGSSSKSDAVRQKIYDRAIVMAKRRLGFNQQRAEEMRGGGYYKPGGAPGATKTDAAKPKSYRYDASGNLVEQ